MQNVDAAQTESLNHNATVAHGGKHIKNGRIQARSQLQQKDVGAEPIGKPGFPHPDGKDAFVHRQPVIGDLSGVPGVYAFKGGKTGGADLDRPAAQHDLPVKGEKYTRVSGGGHGKGGAQIVRPVGQHVRKGQLRTGEYHGNVDSRQHEGNGGGGIGHGVRAVGNDYAVKTCPFLKNMPGNELPHVRGDIGGVQADEIPDRDPVVGAQLFQFPLHHAAAVGLQPLSAGYGSNGAAGGQKQNVLFIHSSSGILPAPSKNGGQIFIQKSL